MEILTKSLLNISESIGIPRNPLLAINPNISNLTYNPLPINSYPSFPPAPQNKVVHWATLFCRAGGVGIPFFSWLRQRPASGREIKKGRHLATFFYFRTQLEASEATKLAHVELLNLDAGGNLEH